MRGCRIKIATNTPPKPATKPNGSQQKTPVLTQKTQFTEICRDFGKTIKAHCPSELTHLTAEFARAAHHLVSSLIRKTTCDMESLIIGVYAVELRSWRRYKMPKWGYSVIAEELDQEKTVKASGREVRVSHKHSREICRTVKGMMLNQAKTYLLDVMEKKKAVPFRRYQKKAGHRRGLDKAFAGRYPIKAAEKILKIIQGAQANAENKGLDVDKLRIIHAAAYPGMKIKRFTPRAHGRASPKFDTLTHVEIVLGETPGQGVEA